MSAHSRWQYLVLDLRMKLFDSQATQLQRVQDELNRLGLQGWELVSLIPMPGAFVQRATFKRAG
ncbi:DUF4177 domain-containing protein [Arenimonas oryziterrae]|uniref:DUF4177 domain-containing protein n=1 Tax=Arenimonas oryziterrae DSM 21050 = YC6267 TaxID=1121015 RepID=A0A091AWU6_9GAMM|nr:DUF4177 domain-containing protein [Arenimonas oryziterrae]KFN44768.1 hypothetical protein N789_01785 [Arenimonas oryziterrae DSM 21050 = YC6267]